MKLKITVLLTAGIVAMGLPLCTSAVQAATVNFDSTASAVAAVETVDVALSAENAQLVGKEGEVPLPQGPQTTSDISPAINFLLNPDAAARFWPFGAKANTSFLPGAVHLPLLLD